MADWMSRLAQHYAAVRTAHPHDRLLVVFDIDGTILDMRHMVCHVLVDYDRVHGTDHFRGLRPRDVDVHENDVASFLERRQLPAQVRAHVLGWYLDRRWQPDAVRAAHVPYPDVMAVIRWFQIQPSTFVALNTGRPERLRADTLHSLDSLGRSHRVQFTDELLHMNPTEPREVSGLAGAAATARDGAADGARGADADVVASKLAGLEAFATAGYRTVAVFDNEPDVIAGLAAADETGDILFLHAQTLYESRRPLAAGTPSGQRYDLRALVGENDLPDRVQLVWHGVNDRANLRQFLASPVQWGECDVRRHPDGRLALRHDPFDRRDAHAEAASGHRSDASSDAAGGHPNDGSPNAAPGHPSDAGAEASLPAGELLRAARMAGKAVKLDIKEPGVVEDVLALVADAGLSDNRLWFNGRVDLLGEPGIRRIRRAHPGAILQCPVDFVAPLVAAAPDRARDLLDLFAGWGIDRFSLASDGAHTVELLDRFDAWGHDVNLYAVDGLEQFLHAVVLLPRLVTADFNFPEWHYFGRGAGHQGRYHRYTVDPAAPARPAVDVA